MLRKVFSIFKSAALAQWCKHRPDARLRSILGSFRKLIHVIMTKG